MDHRKKGVNGDSPKVEQASSVDDSGDDHAEGEEGDGEVNSEDQADDEDGEEGEADVDQHVVHNDLHSQGDPKVIPKKDVSLKVLRNRIIIRTERKDDTFASRRASISSIKSMATERG